MRKETWEPVKHYKGYYEVSDLGRVRSLDRVVLSNERTKRILGKVLKPKQHPDKYLFVSLSKGGTTKTAYIHRLVANAFIPNPRGLAEVNHKSGDKRDNAIANLEWVSHQQNVQHAYLNSLTSNMGGKHSFAVGVIDNQLGREFGTLKEWCDARSINYSTGRNLLNGTKEKHSEYSRIDLTRVVKVIKNKSKKVAEDIKDRHNNSKQQ